MTTVEVSYAICQKGALSQTFLPMGYFNNYLIATNLLPAFTALTTLEVKVCQFSERSECWLPVQ